MISEQQIRDMEPGRELDALVADKVMGWELSATQTNWMHDHNIAAIVVNWHPSTNISAAWEVVEKMQKRFNFFIANERGEKEIRCTFQWYRGGVDNMLEYVIAATAPEAICKCALIAILRGGSGE